MIAQRPHGNNHFSQNRRFLCLRKGLGVIFALIGASLATVGCRSPDPESAQAADAGARPDARLRDARRPPPERDPDVLGRAGPVTLDLAGLRDAVTEARILERWRHGRPPPLDALGDPRLRQRVMTQALEARIARRETARRGLTVDPARFDEMLRLAAIGHRLEQPPTPAQLEAARAVADVDAALVARFEAPAERVRRAGLDVLEGELLAAALLDAVDEATLRQAWLDAGTRVVLDLVRVPRVPATAEIDRAIRTRAAEIAAYHAEHRRLFSTPERAFVRRLLVPVAADADPASRAAAKARAEALRAEVAGGADFEAVIRREAPPREARRGGRMAVTRTQMPAAFEGPAPAPDAPGPLSPVVPVGEGWQFFRVEGRAPAVSRGLDDPRVQREIAAELLRDADDLPHAQRTAGRVAELLARDPDGAALAELVKAERLRRTTTTPVPRAGPKVLPEVGIAPALFDAAFALTPEAPVSAPMPVRQHYVVARLVSREAPDPADWPAARQAFTATWRARQRSTVIDRWLSTHLADAPLWIDRPRLAALSLADLGISDAALAASRRAHQPDAGTVDAGSVEAGAVDAGAAP